jgi:hypothetical protein
MLGAFTHFVTVLKSKMNRLGGCGLDSRVLRQSEASRDFLEVELDGRM